jgi:hypothetical protein
MRYQVRSRSLTRASVLGLLLPCCARLPPPFPTAPAVPNDAERVVVAPSDLALVRPRAQSTTAVMLVRFAPRWGNQNVVGAFLLLGASDGSWPDSRPVTLTVARILDAWDRATVTWGRLPRTSPPEFTATVNGAAADPLRIDVTPLVRRWATARPSDQGFAIVFDGTSPFSSAYAPGDANGTAPRLDVYVR